MLVTFQFKLFEYLSDLKNDARGSNDVINFFLHSVESMDYKDVNGIRMVYFHKVVTFFRINLGFFYYVQHNRVNF